jgi:hypothetical protein
METPMETQTNPPIASERATMTVLGIVFTECPSFGWIATVHDGKLSLRDRGHGPTPWSAYHRDEVESLDASVNVFGHGATPEDALRDLPRALAEAAGIVARMALALHVATGGEVRR